MVLISHGRNFFTKFGDMQDLSFNGLLGVELFFVLSGFLIGRIIIRDFIEGNGSLLTFYKRRWMRTLPAYFFVLTILIIVGKSTGSVYYFDHYFFIQNFDYKKLSFFGVSWSLSIEEWFYLLTPLSLFILMKCVRIDRKLLFFGFCFTVIAISVAAKIFYTFHFNPPWDAGIRKQIFLRMDSLMFGVLLAGVKHFYRHFYDRISSAKLFVLSTSVMVGVILYYIIELEAGRPRMDHSIIGRTVLFDIISVTFVLMIWALEKSRRINVINGSIKAIVTFIAVTSYSVYLIHLDIFIYITSKTTAIHSLPVMFLILAGSIATTYIVAYVLHRFWEKPFMNLRERKNKSVLEGSA